jgi:high affinity Mn2+ porin
MTFPIFGSVRAPAVLEFRLDVARNLIPLNRAATDLNQLLGLDHLVAERRLVCRWHREIDGRIACLWEPDMVPSPAASPGVSLGGREDPPRHRFRGRPRCRTRHSVRLIGEEANMSASRRFVTIGQYLPMLVFVLGTYAAEARAEEVNGLSDQSYDWTGLYLGGHMGLAWGNSSWTAVPGISGSTDLFQKIDTFDNGGSFFGGFQGGFNYVLPNRVLLGAEVDASFPAWPTLPTGANPFGVSIGGSSRFDSPALGPVSFAETVESFGSLRGRIGYAPSDWLFYVTGGFAWTYDQQSLTQVSTGNTDTPYRWRFGEVVGAGIEAPIAPQWTARLEYLFTDYGKSTTKFFAGAQPVKSDFQLQELRLGLNYQFGSDLGPASAPVATEAPAEPEIGNLSLHGQGTLVWQGYPAIRSPYQGAQSLPSGGEGRETSDVTLYAGLRLWEGAELWVNPEIDQGFGLADTHGAAGFPSAEAYKLGAVYPYAAVRRYFIRQTIDLGGESQNVNADINQFAGSQTENRLVLTVGKFSVVDIFDTNQYANNPKIDFLNWSLVNAGTFDYAADAWGFTYGAAAEWYQRDWTLRAGAFDLTATPTGSAGSAPGYGLTPTFRQFQLVGEIEERHTLWEQPGAIKVTGFLNRGNAGSFRDAINLSQATGLDVNDALAAVRHYQSRPGVSINLTQQVSDTLGVFARAGWADGNVEPWDFTDIDQTVSGGVSVNGKQWGRPDDILGVAGVLNGISGVHAAWFNDGGLGILIGDGQLPRPALEKIIETYYSYALTSALRLSLDYQLIAAPGYNPQRGPASIGAVRVRVQF